MSTQKLMTAELRQKLPPLYANENLPTNEAVVVAHFFNAYGAGDWYITEFDGRDTMFGFVYGLGGDEWGYVSLSELTALRTVSITIISTSGAPSRAAVPFQAIERDRHWVPVPFGKLEARLGNVRPVGEP